MKKFIILAAFALMIGIYAFQDNEKVSETTDEVTTSKPKLKRGIASIPSFKQVEASAAPAAFEYAANTTEQDSVNCLNYDGDDVCQDYNSVPEPYPDDSSFTQTEIDSQPVSDASAIQDMEEAAPSDYESEQENALYAASMQEE